MGKLTDIKHRVKDWKEGIPPEHRAEARKLRDDISDLQSRIDSIHRQIQPSTQSVVNPDLFGYDVTQQQVLPPDVSSGTFSSLNTEALQYIEERKAKEAKLDALRTKKKALAPTMQAEMTIGEKMNLYMEGTERITAALEPVYRAVHSLKVDERTGKTPLRQALASVRNALAPTSDKRADMTQGAALVVDDATAQAHVLSKMKEWMLTPAPLGGGMNDADASPLIRALADVLKDNASA